MYRGHLEGSGSLLGWTVSAQVLEELVRELVELLWDMVIPGYKLYWKDRE